MDLNGYVALGALFCEIIEKKTHPEVNKEFEGMGEAKKQDLKRLAKHIVYEGTKTKIDREIRNRKEDLWTEACNQGIANLIVEFQSGNKQDMQAFTNAILEQTSWRSQLKIGILSAFLFGALLVLIQEIDNPLAASIDTFWGGAIDKESSDSDLIEDATRGLPKPSAKEP